MKKFLRTLASALMLTLLIGILPLLSACSDEKKAENATDQTQEQDAKNGEGEKTDEKQDQEAAEPTEEEASSEEIEVGPFEGMIPPDFELSAFNDDKSYKLSDYLGKDPVIITFFASWCGPCRAEMPDLDEVYKAHKDKGLKVFAVNLGNGDNPEDVEQLISDYLLSFPVLKDEKSEAARFYSIRGIPVNIFVGKDGIIKKHAVGMQTKESYEEEIKALFEEQ